MTVWMVHPDKKLDLSQALIYGDIQYINGRYVYADELDENNNLPKASINAILKAVDQFDYDQDYLLIAGDHLQLIAMAAMLQERWGFFRVLRYDREAKGYVSVNIGVMPHDIDPRQDDFGQGK